MSPPRAWCPTLPALLQLPGRHCPWLFPAIAHPPWPSCGIPGWSSLVLGPVRSRDNWHPRDGVGALLSHHFTVLVFPWCCCAFAGSQLRAMTNLFSKQAQSKREVCANPRGGGGITARGWTGEARRWSSWECPATEQPCRQQPPVQGVGTAVVGRGTEDPQPSPPAAGLGCRQHAGTGCSRQGRQAWAISTQSPTYYGQSWGSHMGCFALWGSHWRGRPGRKHIDLLLLKPELLSGTPQPGCPRVLPGKGCPVCPHQREMGPPKHLATAMARAGFGWQPGHVAKDSVLPLVLTALLPSAWLPVAHCPPGPAQHPCTAQGSLVIPGRVAGPAVAPR